MYKKLGVAVLVLGFFMVAFHHTPAVHAEDFTYSGCSVPDGNGNEYQLLDDPCGPTGIYTHLSRCTVNSASINASYDECVSLAYLYEETDGDNRGSNVGWFSSTDLSTWAGTDEGFENAFVFSGGHITELHLGYNSLSGAILSGLDNLSWLNVLVLGGNNISYIDIDPLPSLHYLVVSDNPLDSSSLNSFDFSSQTGLTDILMNSVGIMGGTINLSGLTQLQQFQANNNVLYYMDVSTNTALIALSLDDTQLYEIDLSTNTLLEHLFLTDNYLRSIDLSGLDNLQYLYLDGNDISSIDVSNAVGLKVLEASRNNTLTGLDLTNNTAIESVNVEGNVLQTLDVTSYTLYTHLAEFGISYNSLCYITNPNTLSFLSTYAGNRQEKQFFCFAQNLTGTGEDTSIGLSWDAPITSAAETGTVSESVKEYFIQWRPEGGYLIGNEGGPTLLSNEQYLTLCGVNNDGGLTTLCMSLPGYGSVFLNNDVFDYTIQNLENGQAYEITFCTTHLNEGPDMNVCNTITVTAGINEQEVIHQTHSSGGGGGPMHIDSCPNGDSSGSYYDHECGNKTKAQNVVDRLIGKWADRSADRIQSTVNVLVALNAKIQAKPTVSDALKALFQEIVDLLIAHYGA